VIRLRRVVAARHLKHVEAEFHPEVRDGIVA
jgi:hypothetical protein